MIENRRERRHLHIRQKMAGSAAKPRLCVARSNRNVSAQLVDDASGRVITGVSSLTPAVAEMKLKRIAAAKEVGKRIAEKAKSLGIQTVVFDRAGFRYHGRVKAVAEGAREGGLKL